MNRKEIEDAFIEFAREDIESALLSITSLFVGLNIAYCDMRGNEGDGKKEINIEGHEGQRKITIHAA